ncbi:transcription factor with AP2 domain(s), putative (ApiAP2) [Plasmodium ovale curtisi]|uniref:Transcription factor with AP2 domain(S), putative (ApiAP2) n=1 Tax=Plasmodium ovale curtisi TaxID=864141 RepID=A0A1A8X028_PLAOA|nr:transcription factor with AP2 domain(s), putative (ApiAP2) [Plasmodium ovale curtisi]
MNGDPQSFDELLQELDLENYVTFVKNCFTNGIKKDQENICSQDLRNLAKCLPRVSGVWYDLHKNSWEARWTQGSKSARKYYSVQKFGFHEARKLAIKTIRTKEINYIYNTINEDFNKPLKWNLSNDFLEMNYDPTINLKKKCRTKNCKIKEIKIKKDSNNSFCKKEICDRKLKKNKSIPASVSVLENVYEGELRVHGEAYEGISKDVTDDVPKDVTDDVPKDVTDDLPKDITKDVPKDVLKDAHNESHWEYERNEIFHDFEPSAICTSKNEECTKAQGKEVAESANQEKNYCIIASEKKEQDVCTFSNKVNVLPRETTFLSNMPLSSPGETLSSEREKTPLNKETSMSYYQGVNCYRRKNDILTCSGILHKSEIALSLKDRNKIVIDANKKGLSNENTNNGMRNLNNDFGNTSSRTTAILCNVTMKGDTSIPEVRGNGADAITFEETEIRSKRGGYVGSGGRSGEDPFCKENSLCGRLQRENAEKGKMGSIRESSDKTASDDIRQNSQSLENSICSRQTRLLQISEKKMSRNLLNGENGTTTKKREKKKEILNDENRCIDNNSVHVKMFKNCNIDAFATPNREEKERKKRKLGGAKKKQPKNEEQMATVVSGDSPLEDPRGGFTRVKRTGTKKGHQSGGRNGDENEASNAASSVSQNQDQRNYSAIVDDENPGEKEKMALDGAKKLNDDLKREAHLKKDDLCKNPCDDSSWKKINENKDYERREKKKYCTELNLKDSAHSDNLVIFKNAINLLLNDLKYKCIPHFDKEFFNILEIIDNHTNYVSSTVNEGFLITYVHLFDICVSNNILPSQMDQKIQKVFCNALIAFHILLFNFHKEKCAVER